MFKIVNTFSTAAKDIFVCKLFNENNMFYISSELEIKFNGISLKDL